MASAGLLSLMTLSVLLACVASTQAQSGPTVGRSARKLTDVNCFIDPCETAECRTKCLGLGSNYVCRANYTIGCDCDCLTCTPAKELCSVDRKDLKCCGKNVCDFTSSCVNNPLTKCGTICTPKDESLTYCKKRNTKCEPKKVQCCNGTDCRLKAGLTWYSKNKQYTCQKCKQYKASCIIGKSECCSPYMNCQNPKTTKKGEKGTCEIVAHRGVKDA